MDEWTGEHDCVNYRGVVRRKEGACCGGRKVVKILTACKVHKQVYAGHACHKASCRYYEKKRG